MLDEGCWMGDVGWGMLDGGFWMGDAGERFKLVMLDIDVGCEMLDG